MSERKFSLIRAGKAWLLLTDDARHLFCLSRYWEDGSAEYGDSGKPIRGWFWRAELLRKDTGLIGDVPRPVELVRRGERRRIVGFDHAVVTAGEWDDWRSLARTRRELVEELHDYTGYCDCPVPGEEDIPAPGDLIPDPEHPGKFHTVDHVLVDGNVLRIGTIVGHVLLRPRECQTCCLPFRPERAVCEVCGERIYRPHGLPWLHEEDQFLKPNPHAATPRPPRPPLPPGTGIGARLARRPRSMVEREQLASFERQLLAGRNPADLAGPDYR